jgi:hypothetical protein
MSKLRPIKDPNVEVGVSSWPVHKEDQRPTPVFFCYSMVPEGAAAHIFLMSYFYPCFLSCDNPPPPQKNSNRNIGVVLQIP